MGYYLSPPFYNFAIVPVVTTRDAFWEMKRNFKDGKSGIAKSISGKYEDIHMQKNTPMGMYLAGFVFVIGFAMVWHIYWLAIVGLIGAIACVVIRTFDEDTEYVLTAKEIEKMEIERFNRSQK